MKHHYLYKTTNIPITESKGFQTLLTNLSYQPHTTAIICDNKTHVSNLEETLQSNTTLETSPITISLEDLINVSYTETYSKNKNFLLLYFKNYLHHFQHIPFRKTLYASHTLMENAIQHFINEALSTQKIMKKKSLFDSEMTDQLNDLHHEFQQYLTQNHSINLKSYYKQTTSAPKLATISEYFFINTTLTEPWHKRCIYNIIQNTQSTWLLDTSFEQEINWLEQSFPNINAISEKQAPLLEQTIIKEYETHLEEIEDTIHNMNNLSKKEPETAFCIIIPRNPAYKQSIEQVLIKHKTPINSAKKKESNQNIIDSIISLLTFIKTPFSLESLATMTSHPWLQRNYSNQLIININQVKQYIKTQDKTPTIKSIHSLLETLKQQKENTAVSSIETQLKNVLTIHKYHQILTQTISPSIWFNHLLTFSDHFDVLQSQNNQDILKTKEKILDFMAIQLTYLSTLSETEYSSHFACDWLIHALTHLYADSPTEKHPISLTHIETTLFKPNTSYFILGLNHTMYQNIDNSKDYFETLKPLFQPNNKNNSYTLLTMYLTNLHSTSNTLYLSNAKTVHDTETIPLNLKKIKPSLKKETESKTVLKRKKTNKKNNSLKTHNVTFPELSATMIDTYQSCPYKFWLHYVLKLEPEQEIQQSISAKDWGIIIHKMMEEFNKWLKKHPTPTKKTSLTTLNTIANQQLSVFPNNAMWSIKRHQLLGHESTPGLIHTIIDIYHENNYLLKPIDTETKQSIIINNTIIKAVVDALFQTKTGTVIVDYKTGKKIASPADIKNGKSLQLPIYLLCNENEIIDALIYFQIHNHDKTTLAIPACQESFKKEYLEKRKRPFLLTASFPKTIKNHLHKLIELIQDNHFTHAPHPNLEHDIIQSQETCYFCSNSLICRKPSYKNQ